MTLDPEQFVITRRRKKYKFALFHNAGNCFEFHDWRDFAKKQSLKNIVVEVGAGTGLFLVELAEKYSEKTFIALDIKADRLQKGARLAAEKGLTNIYFVRARADQLLEVVKPGSVMQIWLTFSDPFPKKRDAKKRLTHPKFLELYKKAHVSKNAELLFKTDSHPLFDWSLEQLVASGWRLSRLTFDLHESDLPADYKTMTTYEKKWTKQGLPIYFLRASL